MEAFKIFTILTLCWIAAVNANVRQDALDEHNRLRALHGVPPLKLSKELNKQAAGYAKELSVLKELKRYSVGDVYGENLCTRPANPEKCMEDWYNQIKYYNFDKPRDTPETRGFTQIVWAATNEMGYGQAKDSNGHYYVVVFYTPPGNKRGLFEKMVLRRLPAVEESTTVVYRTTTESKSGRFTVSNSAMIISICFGLYKLTY